METYWLPNIVGNPNHGFDWFLTSWNWLGNRWSKCGLVTGLTGTEPDFGNTSALALISTSKRPYAVVESTSGYYRFQIPSRKERNSRTGLSSQSLEVDWPLL